MVQVRRHSDSRWRRGYLHWRSGYWLERERCAFVYASDEATLWTEKRSYFFTISLSIELLDLMVSKFYSMQNAPCADRVMLHRLSISIACSCRYPRPQPEGYSTSCLWMRRQRQASRPPRRTATATASWSRRLRARCG